MMSLSPLSVAVGAGIGILLSFLCIFLCRKYPEFDRANLVAKTILWGQGLTVCLLLPALELPGDASRSYRSAIRFELGWLVTTTMCIVFAFATWKIRRESSRVAKVLMVGIAGIAATQLLSSIVAEDVLPISAYVPMLTMGVGLILFPLTFDAASKTLTHVMAVMCIVSIATIFVDRDWALPIAERRTIPGPFGDQSLGGVLQHPNLLAPVASFGLALVLGGAHRNRMPLVLLFLGTIWLTDSRTQIAAAILALLIWCVRVSVVRFGRRTTMTLSGVVSGCVILAGFIIGLFTTWRFDSRNFGLARRPELWSKAIEYWQSSKIVGVGSAAFNKEYRLESGNRGAVGAHNQFLQSLASDGLLGIVPVLVVFCLVVYAVWRAQKMTRFAFGLVGVVGLTLFMFETPLQLQLHRTGHVFLYVCVFAALTTAVMASDAHGRGSSDESSTTHEGILET